MAALDRLRRHRPLTLPRGGSFPLLKDPADPGGGLMAVTDSSLIDSVTGALSDVTEVASESLATVSSALSDLSEKKTRKGLLILVVIAILAVLGYVAWK